MHFCKLKIKTTFHNVPLLQKMNQLYLWRGIAIARWVIRPKRNQSNATAFFCVRVGRALKQHLLQHYSISMDLKSICLNDIASKLKIKTIIFLSYDFSFYFILRLWALTDCLYSEKMYFTDKRLRTSLGNTVF